MLGAFLDQHRIFPPALVMVKYETLCFTIGHDDPKTTEALLEILNVVQKYLPDSYKVDFWELKEQTDNRTTGTMTVPLYEVIDVRRPITSILWHFIHENRDDHHYELRKRLLDNENAYHKVTNLSRRSTYIPPPTEIDEEPQDLIKIYLSGTPFYDFFMYTQVPFQIPGKTWSSHGLVLAPSGHGKTQLLGSLISGFLTDDDSPGLFVLDPHGDLYNTLRERVSSERLVTLDPDTNPPPLNFLDFGNATEAATLQTFSYLMSSLSGGLTEKQSAITPYLLKLLRKVSELEGYASIETLRLIVDEKVKRPEQSAFSKAIAQLPMVDQGFFNSTWFHSSMEQTKQAVAWKLYAALSSDAFREMFAGERTIQIDFDRLVAERKVVVVKGGRAALGTDGMRVFLQFIVAQYYSAALRRIDALPERDRHLNLFICDEASHILTTPIIADMLFEMRKAGCGLLAATQVWEQVATPVKAAVLGNTAIKIVGPVQHNDASVLSREMYCDIDFIRGMQRYDGQPFAHWAMYVAGMTQQAARVTVPFGKLERMERINPRGQSAYEFPKQEGDTHKRVSPSQPGKPGAHKAFETVTRYQETASISQTDRDVLLIVNACKKFETALRKKYGATGKGFGEKFQSVIDKMPKHLHDAADQFNGIRNRQIHQDGFELYDETRETLIENIELLEDFFTRSSPEELPDDDHIRPSRE